MRVLGLIGTLLGAALLLLAIPAIDTSRSNVAAVASVNVGAMFAVVLVLVAIAIVFALVYALMHS